MCIPQLLQAPVLHQAAVEHAESQSQGGLWHLCVKFQCTFLGKLFHEPQHAQVSLTTTSCSASPGLQPSARRSASRCSAAALAGMLRVAATERPDAAWSSGDCSPSPGQVCFPQICLERPWQTSSVAL